MENKNEHRTLYMTVMSSKSWSHRGYRDVMLQKKEIKQSEKNE
jgi:hypothetical protein